jgi:hypothetical protein
LAGGLFAVAGLVAIVASQWDNPPVVMMRNFYGVVTVYDRDADDPEAHDLAFFSGNIMHGAQFVDPAKRKLPFTYYTPSTGIARTLDYLHEKQGNLRVGTVGLGIGTLAAYARPGDHFVFYEINPNVVTLAKEYFSYLSDTKGQIDEMVLGDARISLERQSPENFDVLALDAFSGDAIPVHLLTSEAFEIYDRHLSSTSGTLVVNVTNTYLDASPVVAGLAKKFGFGVARLQTPGDYDHDICRTDWMVLSRDPALIELLQTLPQNVPVSDREIVWTDGYSNLFEILKWPAVLCTVLQFISRALFTPVEIPIVLAEGQSFPRPHARRSFRGSTGPWFQRRHAQLHAACAAIPQLPALF